MVDNCAEVLASLSTYLPTTVTSSGSVIHDQLQLNLRTKCLLRMISTLNTLKYFLASKLGDFKRLTYWRGLILPVFKLNVL